jgi:hypothetical protein
MFRNLKPQAPNNSGNDRPPNCDQELKLLWNLGLGLIAPRCPCLARRGLYARSVRLLDKYLFRELLVPLGYCWSAS